MPASKEEIRQQLTADKPMWCDTGHACPGPTRAGLCVPCRVAKFPDEYPNALTCVKCGEVDDPDRTMSGPKMQQRGLCFMCNYWVELHEKDAQRPESVAIIDGKHYVIAEERGELRFRGFGGSPFLVVFHDGRRVATTNLWHQGPVPPHFLELFPDNAAFDKTPSRRSPNG